MALQLQWNLDKTVNSALAVARGVFLAANKDNLQPLAIISCEKFGNTIAMSSETCVKVEGLIAQTSKLVAISFIQAYAGFDADDSAAQLSKSMAGVRFLGLVAALVTSLELFDAASSIQKMLESSASEKDLLPSTRQLKDLLTSLQPRLVSSGFLNSVIGWHLFLDQALNDNQDIRNILKHERSYPGPEAINGLVDAFRQLSRIGEDDVKKISIFSANCVPWIIAFTKWCLGLPPTVLLEDGTLILLQSESRVEITITQEKRKDPEIRISIHRSISSPSALVETGSSKNWHGMVPIEVYSKWTLYDLKLDSGLARQALLQAIPFALSHILHNMKFSNYCRFSDSCSGIGSRCTRDCPQLDEDLLILRLNPLPEERVVVQVMLQYLGDSDAKALKSLDGLRLEDLTAMKLHIKELKTSCSCNECLGVKRQAYIMCDVNQFKDAFSRVCADILALSLFGSRELPLLFSPKPRDQARLARSISSELFSYHKLRVISVWFLLLHGLFLTGQGPEATLELPTLMMSSSKGQVIYPLLYETLHIEKHGYLALNWIPGNLIYHKQKYSRVYCGSEIRNSASIGDITSKYDVTVPLNLEPTLYPLWLVEKGDDSLSVTIGLKGQEHLVHRVRHRTYNIFERLASSLILETCAHSPAASLDAADTFCRYTSPIDPAPPKDEKHGIQMTNVVAVNGSESMRFFSLTSNCRKPFVLRKKACLSCCLDICRKSNYPVLVL